MKILNVDTVLKLKGSEKLFYCDCKCNVFTEIDDGTGNIIYMCNSCKQNYELNMPKTQ